MQTLGNDFRYRNFLNSLLTTHHTLTSNISHNQLHLPDYHQTNNSLQQLHLPHIAIAALLKPRNQKLRNFLDPSTGGFLLYYSRSADGGALAQRGEIQCTENRFSINANKSFLWKYDQSFQRLNDM